MDKMEKTTEKKKGFVREFTDFLQTFGVIGLAIGFVIGVASSAVVNSLVKDLINPIVGLVLPTGNLASLNATVISPVSGKPSVFLYGDFISQVIYFIIIAPGPTSSGNAIGKTAVSSAETRVSLSMRSPRKMISIDSKSRTRPPAIWKLSRDIPNSSKTS